MPARMPSVSNIATSVPNPTRAPPPGKEFNQFGLLRSLTSCVQERRRRNKHKL